MIAVPPGVHILLATQPVDFRDSVRWAASVSRGRFHFMGAILDNYGTHKHSKVLAWLGRHPRWTFHFTPTSGSWLNAVETFFSALTRRRLKQGVFGSLVELQAAIHRYIAEHNDAPAPFVWTKSPDRIVDKRDRLDASLH